MVLVESFGMSLFATQIVRNVVRKSKGNAEKVSFPVNDFFVMRSADEHLGQGVER